MKKIIASSSHSFLPVYLILLFLISCNQQENQKNNEPSERTKSISSTDDIDLNLPAMYTGTLPCADCPGINYQLILEDDGFTELSQYRDRSPEKFEETGSWSANKDTLTLVGQEDLILKRFLFHKDSLTLLDRNKQKITGDLADIYVLERVGNQESIRKHHQKLSEQGFIFFAAGNEPFWSIKIDSLNLMTYEKPGSTRNLGEVSRSMIENGILFETSADSIQLSIRVQDKYCRDSMSGYLFPETVTAVMKSSQVDTLRGCGLFLEN
ncbi:MAG: copper resistance protein NlpE N-terminal domain-containing protein [Balneolaceae bacterium]|nr:copper resistance protein NlpE N-terminal domain-containing protein [Balneolaceae bacterium]MDR9409373.1 copper resistance protein NlpE N-terminal domain-containing protein [Balneolaceae bacterium]